jgi:hypothetical protein
MKKENMLYKLHLDTAKYLESLLNPISDDLDFRNGSGKKLQEERTISFIVNILNKIFKTEIINSNFYDKKELKEILREQITIEGLHFYCSRASFLPQYNSLIYRLNCIDKGYYEHGQIYFKLKEDEEYYN